MNRELAMNIATQLNRRPQFVYAGRGDSVAFSKVYYEIDDFTRIEVTPCEVCDDQLVFSIFLNDRCIASTTSSNGTTIKEALTALLDLARLFLTNRSTSIQNTYNMLHRN